MPEAAVNGATLYYEEAGTGVPFIVLHGGLGFDHSYMQEAFGPVEDVMHAIYLDQRGNGRSSRPALETINIPQLAEDVDGLRAALGLERVGVIGHSYGGFVALEFATRYPDRVSHLICMDTSPGMFEPTEDELAERGDRSWITPEVQGAFGFFAQGLPTTDVEFRDAFEKIAPVYVAAENIPKFVDLMAACISDVATGAQSMQALAGWSVADKLGLIAAPTLVLCGRRDLLTTPECSKRLATAIPDAELVWFENSGHFPDVEEPEVFRAAVRDWISRHHA